MLLTVNLGSESVSQQRIRPSHSHKITTAGDPDCIAVNLGFFNSYRRQKIQVDTGQDRIIVRVIERRQHAAAAAEAALGYQV